MERIWTGTAATLLAGVLPTAQPGYPDSTSPNDLLVVWPFGETQIGTSDAESFQRALTHSASKAARLVLVTWRQGWPEQLRFLRTTPSVLRLRLPIERTELLDRIAALEPVSDNEWKSLVERAFDVALEIRTRERRRFLLHELGAGKPFAVALDEVARAIGIDGVASDTQRKTLDRSWQALQEQCGGLIAKGLIDDPVIASVAPGLRDLAAWVNQACAGDLDLALAPRRGLDTLAKIRDTLNDAQAVPR